MASHTASLKSTARKALYFARRRTDRSLTTSATVNIWNSLNSHRSSLHGFTSDGALVAQLQSYADIVDFVASASRRSSAIETNSTLPSSVLQLVDVYGALVDCVGYLGAEQAACTAFLPPTQLPYAACTRVGNREMFLYAQAAFAAEVCFRTLGRRTPAAAKSKVLAAMRLYNDDADKLSACRRRLLPDLSTAEHAHLPSAADAWKCGHARRLRQLRRLQLNLNTSVSDEADSVLGEFERDIIAKWVTERYTASWRLTLSVAALSTSLIYLLIGVVCQCRTLCRSNVTMSPLPCDKAGAMNQLDVDENEMNDLERHPACLDSQLAKTTFV